MLVFGLVIALYGCERALGPDEAKRPVVEITSKGGSDNYKEMKRTGATPPQPVERTPPRTEPAYQNTPYYCLLVIGPEAKQRWLVLDGETVDLDRNGNGDLTDKEDRIVVTTAASAIPDAKAAAGGGDTGPKAPLPTRVTLPPSLVPLGAIQGAIGQTPFSNLMFQRLPSKDPQDIAFGIYTDDPKVLPKQWRPPGNRGGTIGIGTTNPLIPPKPQEAPMGIIVKVAEGVLARRPQEAPIIWFDGPLGMNLALPEQTFLARGDNAAQLSVTVGTIVSEKGSRILTLEEIPSGVHPVADVEFPAKGRAKPIRAQFVLDDRC
jgi:hypothetical protein